MPGVECGERVDGAHRSGNGVVRDRAGRADGEPAVVGVVREERGQCEVGFRSDVHAERVVEPSGFRGGIQFEGVGSVASDRADVRRGVCGVQDEAVRSLASEIRVTDHARVLHKWLRLKPVSFGNGVRSERSRRLGEQCRGTKAEQRRPNGKNSHVARVWLGSGNLSPTNLHFGHGLPTRVTACATLVYNLEAKGYAISE